MNKRLIRKMDPFIFYKKGFKYQFDSDFHIWTNITGYTRRTRFIELRADGHLIIKAGYAWDGPSGIAFDTKTFMKASGVHDAFYQMIRMKLLPQSMRETADQLMYQICLADKMWKIRAKWCLRGVRKFAAGAAHPRNAREIYSAPRMVR